MWTKHLFSLKFIYDFLNSVLHFFLPINTSSSPWTILSQSCNSILINHELATEMNMKMKIKIKSWRCKLKYAGRLYCLHGSQQMGNRINFLCVSKIDFLFKLNGILDSSKCALFKIRLGIRTCGTDNVEWIKKQFDDKLQHIQMAAYSFLQHRNGGRRTTDNLLSF